ncbi:hypothetical protein P3L44_10150 [Providencia sp. PROV175]|uniref:hypothetical protein n=2 Tax=Providencia sp. PROV175 TaxID=2949878 RepID=UPI00234ADBA7|nr:hypothetical protein [Providencia sp. PROV175]WOB89100.1 hypothetical protein P3L44_10150 [Providencia sp. PROV175]
MSNRKIKKEKNILKDVRIKIPENSTHYALFNLKLKSYISIEYMITCEEDVKYTNDLNKAYITEEICDGVMDIIELDIEKKDDELYSLCFIPVIGTILGVIVDSSELKEINDITDNKVGNLAIAMITKQINQLERIEALQEKLT